MVSQIASSSTVTLFCESMINIIFFMLLPRWTILTFSISYQAFIFQRITRQFISEVCRAEHVTDKKTQQESSKEHDELEETVACKKTIIGMYFTMNIMESFNNNYQNHINHRRPNRHQRQTSLVELWVVLGSTVWRNWQVISCWG